MKTRPKVLFSIKIAVSAALVAYLLFNVEASGLVDAARGIDIFFFLTAVVIGIITVLIRAYKWQLLLNVQGARLTLKHSVAITYMSLFFNNLAPGSIGGDLFRIYRTRNYSAFKSGSISAVVMDRISGIVALFFIVMVFGLFEVSKATPVFIEGKFYVNILKYFFIIMGIIAIILILIFLLQLNKIGLGRLRFFSKIMNRFQDLGRSIAVYRKRKSVVWVTMMISVGFYLTNCVGMYFFSLCVTRHINFLDLLIVVPAITFLAMIPISVNGIGIQEGSYYFFFQSEGIGAESSLLIALLPRFVMLIFSLIGAVLYVWEARSGGLDQVPESDLNGR